MPRRGDWKACWKAPKTPSTGWASVDPNQDRPRAGPHAWFHRSYLLHPRWRNCLPESLGLPPTPRQVMLLGQISQFQWLETLFKSGNMLHLKHTLLSSWEPTSRLSISHDCSTYWLCLILFDFFPLVASTSNVFGSQRWRHSKLPESLICQVTFLSIHVASSLNCKFH